MQGLRQQALFLFFRKVLLVRQGKGTAGKDLTGTAILFIIISYKSHISYNYLFSNYIVSKIFCYGNPDQSYWVRLYCSTREQREET